MPLCRPVATGQGARRCGMLRPLMPPRVAVDRSVFLPALVSDTAFRQSLWPAQFLSRSNQRHPRRAPIFVAQDAAPKLLLVSASP
ncbi:unnamed protein product, partial [Closterium sp. Naga37s-1]